MRQARSRIRCNKGYRVACGAGAGGCGFDMVAGSTQALIPSECLSLRVSLKRTTAGQETGGRLQNPAVLDHGDFEFSHLLRLKLRELDRQHAVLECRLSVVIVDGVGKPECPVISAGPSLSEQVVVGLF